MRRPISSPGGVGFGPHVVYFAVASFLAYLFGGHAGIYLSQRLSTPKQPYYDLPTTVDVSLRDAHERRSG